MLRRSAISAILVEIGFISHPQETELLTDSRHQERVAQAILEGLENFIEWFAQQYC